MTRYGPGNRFVDRPHNYPRLTLYYIDATTGSLLCHTDGREWCLPAVGSSLGVPGVDGKCVVVRTREIGGGAWDVVVRRPIDGTGGMG